MARVSAASEEGLDQALARWLEQGYEARRWEELHLPLEGGNRMNDPETCPHEHDDLTEVTLRDGMFVCAACGTT